MVDTVINSNELEVDPAILWQVFWSPCRLPELRLRAARAQLLWAAAVSDQELWAASLWPSLGIVYSARGLENGNEMLMTLSSSLSIFTLTSYRVSVHSRLQCSDFDVIYAHHMLMVGVGRKPWYDCAWASYICSLNICWSQMRDVTANDHRASGISRRPSVSGDATDTHAMWLQKNIIVLPACLQLCQQINLPC